MPHALAVIDVTEGSSPRDIPVKQPARYHGSSWHDADDLADATTLVGNLRVRCYGASGDDIASIGKLLNKRWLHRRR